MQYLAQARELQNAMRKEENPFDRISIGGFFRITKGSRQMLDPTPGPYDLRESDSLIALDTIRRKDKP